MTHRGPFQPLPFCDYVIFICVDAVPVFATFTGMGEAKDYALGHAPCLASHHVVIYFTSIRNSGKKHLAPY